MTSQYCIIAYLYTPRQSNEYVNDSAVYVYSFLRIFPDCMSYLGVLFATEIPLNKNLFFDFSPRCTLLGTVFYSGL